jgi:hypothetical protein
VASRSLRFALDRRLPATTAAPLLVLASAVWMELAGPRSAGMLMTVAVLVSASLPVDRS